MSADARLEIVTTVEALRGRIAEWRASGARIAFVPTMGNLHEGHMSLIGRAQAAAGRIVSSIFVNPLQFGPDEDYQVYPRTLDVDAAMLERAGVHLLFAPSVAEMYPHGEEAATRVVVPLLSDILCGAHRPGHFGGMATVVCKLLNIIGADVAVFGEKDYQQLAIVRRMVTDLDLGIEIVGIPTVREADGLAMSSRNAYLSPAERARALSLSRALFAARDAAAGGLRAGERLVAQARVALDVDRIDYVELVDADTLQTVTDIRRPAVLAVAAFVGRTRLIERPYWIVGAVPRHRVGRCRYERVSGREAPGRRRRG